MKHRPFSNLTRHWSPERLAGIEARVDTALAELDLQEHERTADERPSEAVAAARQRQSPELARRPALTSAPIAHTGRPPSSEPKGDRPAQRLSAGFSAKN